jgi:RNA polymerase sigma factor (sigma-70 family)
MTNLNDDKHLTARLQNNKTKRESFSEVVELYQQRLYWHIRKMVVSHDDARDVLQEVFIRVWNGAEKFKGDAPLAVWLYKIAGNESLRFLEKVKKQTAGRTGLEEILIQKLETEPWIDGNESEKKLQKAIFSLPEKQRLVFNMRYFEEMSYEEMSKILDTSVESLKTSYHYASKKITAIIKNEIL